MGVAAGVGGVGLLFATGAGVFHPLSSFLTLSSFYPRLPCAVLRSPPRRPSFWRPPQFGPDLPPVLVLGIAVGAEAAGKRLLDDHVAGQQAGVFLGLVRVLGLAWVLV